MGYDGDCDIIEKALHDIKAAFTQDFGTVLYGTFRVGTDRLPVYTISWNRFVQNRFFQSIRA